MNKYYLLLILPICSIGFFSFYAEGSGFSCDTGTLSDTCTVSSLKTISANDIVSGSGSLVIESGGELRVATTSSFSIVMNGDITIQSGGKISGNLLGATSTNFTIDAGGSINVSGKGYAGQASGVGLSCTGCGGGGGYLSGTGGGGGYGGNGGKSLDDGTFVARGGGGYGSITAPTNFGSSGGAGATYPGLSGGGAVKLIVSGTLTVNGQILSNGDVVPASGPSDGIGGGSGGSIWIQAGTLAGNGTVSANGGNSWRYTDSIYGGAGGGGRIAVEYTTDSSTITYSAKGGNTAVGTYASSYGGAGTIYKKVNANTYGDLTLNNSGLFNASTTISSNLTFASTTIMGGAILDISGNITFDAGSALNLSNLGSLMISSTTSIFTVDALNVNSGTTSISVNKDIATVPDFGVVTVSSGASLTHATSTGSHLYSLIMGASSFTVNSGGYVDVSGKGYPGGTTAAGSTCTSCGGGGTYLANSTGGGGAYGGNGGSGLHTPTTVTGGTSYGLSSSPTDLGSGGGGSGSASYYGGGGGGLIKLIVSGTLTNNGSIVSNGGVGLGNVSSNKGGGGSGGSVWIQTKNLSCSGSIIANGGRGFYFSTSYYGGGGGGGRILLSYESGSPCGTLTASAGIASGSYGLASDGTVVTIVPPTILNTTFSSVTNSSAIASSSISATGGSNATTRGFAYGLTTAYGATTTDSGSFGVSDFNTSLSSLTCNTTYHVRAYATNTAGTSYGTDQTFLTSACIPSVSSSAASSITSTGGVLNGSIDATGGSDIITRGFAYGLTTTYGATTTESGIYSTGDFSTSLSDLTCNTTYHVRAYATNSAEIGYGVDQTFTTDNCPVLTNPDSHSYGSILKNFSGGFSKSSLKANLFLYDNIVYSIGMNDLQVKNIQQVFNYLGFVVSKNGPGSKGLETTFFGRATINTVRNFQRAYNITPTGNVGPKTKAKLIELLKPFYY